jgi:hypothetical protein
MRRIRGVHFCGPHSRTPSALAPVLGVSLQLHHLDDPALAVIWSHSSSVLEHGQITASEIRKLAVDGQGEPVARRAHEVFGHLVEERRAR